MYSERRYLVFPRKKLCAAKSVAMATTQVSFCFFCDIHIHCDISGAKFKEHCSNISGDIVDSVFYCLREVVYDVITSLICIIQKRKYL